MTPTRRDALKLGGATIGIGATAGCLRRLLNRGDDGDGGEDESDSSSEESTSNDNGNSEKDRDANASEQPETDSDDVQNQNQSDSPEQNESNETNATEEDEQEPLAPGEEEVEPDREKYKQDEGGEREKLPRDAISTTEPTMTIGEYGAVDIGGKVTNETDDPISVVTIEVIYYGPDKSEVGRSTANCSNIPPGESEKWSSGVGPDQLRGEPARADVRYQSFTEQS